MVRPLSRNHVRVFTNFIFYAVNGPICDPSRRFSHLAHSVGASSEMKSVDLTDRSSSIPTHEYPVSYITTTSTTTTITTTPSSFSSIMSSPLAGRLSFQTLTNLMPLSWTAVPATSCEITTSIASGNAQRRERVQSAVVSTNYVSKEKQLEKLRSRLQRDGVTMKTAIASCRKCTDEAVFL